MVSLHCSQAHGRAPSALARTTAWCRLLLRRLLSILFKDDTDTILYIVQSNIGLWPISPLEGVRFHWVIWNCCNSNVQSRKSLGLVHVSFATLRQLCLQFLPRLVLFLISPLCEMQLSKQDPSKLLAFSWKSEGGSFWAYPHRLNPSNSLETISSLHGWHIGSNTFERSCRMFWRQTCDMLVLTWLSFRPLSFLTMCNSLSTTPPGSWSVCA